MVGTAHRIASWARGGDGQGGLIDGDSARDINDVVCS
jgi:hypothetical protein